MAKRGIVESLMTVRTRKKRKWKLNDVSNYFLIIVMYCLVVFYVFLISADIFFFFENGVELI